MKTKEWALLWMPDCFFCDAGTKMVQEASQLSTVQKGAV